MTMVLLGADRVGFATMAMIALGCTVCRSCQQDTCHVGITTQIASAAEAAERGLKRFFPQDQDMAVAHLVHFFTALAQGVADQLRDLGLNTIRDAVGRWDLLTQTDGYPLVDMMSFLEELNTWQAAALHVAGQSSPATVAASSATRLIGVGLSGHRTRHKDHLHPLVRPIDRVAGQGFGAFLSPGLTLIARGGAQDGVGKGATDGTIAVVKSPHIEQGIKSTRWIGGHVGKGVGYGAQGGQIIVQGAADARAGIRLSGADLIILGQGVPNPRQARSFWESAVIKGFGFEYMTRGRGLVLGDPGPWLASGMTGGVLYLKHDDDAGLSLQFVRSRLAKGAKVSLVPIGRTDHSSVLSMLDSARTMLIQEGDITGALALDPLINAPERWFVKLVPLAQQTSSEISTE
jgi:glutamate synthase (NADPH/NADH) large chain